MPFADPYPGHLPLLHSLTGVFFGIIPFSGLFIGVSAIPYFLTPLILRRSLRYQTPDEALGYGFIGTVLTSGAICLLAMGVNYLGTLRFHHGDTPLQIAITYLGSALIALCLVEPFPLTLRIQASMRRKRKSIVARIPAD